VSQGSQHPSEVASASCDGPSFPVVVALETPSSAQSPHRDQHRSSTSQGLQLTRPLLHGSTSWIGISGSKGSACSRATRVSIRRTGIGERQSMAARTAVASSLTSLSMRAVLEQLVATGDTILSARHCHAREYAVSWLHRNGVASKTRWPDPVDLVSRIFAFWRRSQSGRKVVVDRDREKAGMPLQSETTQGALS